MHYHLQIPFMLETILFHFLTHALYIILIISQLSQIPLMSFHF
jgi:hypothetical protein